MSASRDFTKSSNAVVFNRDLSGGARLTHTGLMHLAWKRGRREPTDVAEMPPMHELAKLLGFSKNTILGYVRELRDERLVVTKRVRNQGMRYVVLDQPYTDEELSQILRQLEGGAIADFGTSHARAVPYPPKDTRAPNGALASNDLGTRPAPPTVKVDERNLGFDALADVCAIDPRGNRAGVIVAALNGRGKRTGIRELFWLELVEWATEHRRPDVVERLAGGDPEFEHMLVRAITRKAELYRSRLKGAEVTPTALRDWWLDLERGDHRDDAMTPAQMATYGGRRR